MSVEQPAAEWPVVHDAPYPNEGQVQVWRLSLSASAEELAIFGTLLSDDELERAARYRYDRHRHRFVACRARLRMLLAQYLRAAPLELRFAYSSLGKPSLAAPWRDSQLTFNVSDSGELALVAVATRIELGVDIEHVRELNDSEQLARRFFASEECAALDSVPAEHKLAAFFRCWTRKEAVLKALGSGLSMPLDRFVVSLLPDEPARVVSFDGQWEAADAWWLAGLEPAPGYLGAVAAQRPCPELRCWRWEPL